VGRFLRHGVFTYQCRIGGPGTRIPLATPIACAEQLLSSINKTNKTVLIVRRTQLFTAGEQVFPVAAARAWNGLSQHLTSAFSLYQSSEHVWRPSSSYCSYLFVCYRPSVCLSSVTLVRRTQAIEIFGNISTAFVTLTIRWYTQKILRRSSLDFKIYDYVLYKSTFYFTLLYFNPFAGVVKHKSGSQI